MLISEKTTICCRLSQGTIIMLGLLIVSATMTWADKGKVSGYFFGDFYHMLFSHNKDLEGRNGFQYRRIYFQYDRKIKENDDSPNNLAVRLRLEMNGDSLPEKGDKIKPYVKNGYLRWKNSDWNTDVLVGLSGTPALANTEKLWGYRVLSKTPEDLHKFVSSTDFGIAIKGSLADKLINYHVMLANGSGTKAEADSDKKAYFALALKPVDGLLIECYADAETGDELDLLWHGLIGYQNDLFKGGVLFSMEAGENERKMASVFGSAKLLDNLKVVGRFDKNLDPNPKGGGISYTPYSKEASVNNVVFGLDWSPAKDVYILPNVFASFYDEPEKGKKPDLDLQPRLTLYYKF